MSTKPENPRSIIKIYSQAIQSLKNTPKILLPFVIFAGIELFALLLLFLSPRAPLRPLFGPPIATIWGERFLHYPDNFFLLLKLESISRMFWSISVGSLLTGIAVAMLYKKPLSSAYKKYAALFLTVLILTALFYFSSKIAAVLLVKYFLAGHKTLIFLKPAYWLGPMLFGIRFLLAILIQAAFTYAIPIIIATEVKFFKAIFRSFVFLKNNFLATILLVGLPMLIAVPLLVLGSNPFLLMDRLFPEAILLLAIVGIIVNSLIIDPLITIATALFYFNRQDKK